MLSAVVLALGLHLGGVEQDPTAPLIADLTSEDEGRRERAEESLVHSGVDALPALLVAYNRALLPQQQAIKRVVNRIGPQAIEPLFVASFKRELVLGRRNELIDDGIALATAVGEAAIPTAKALAEAPGPGNGGPRLWGGAVLAGLGSAGAHALVDTLGNSDERVRRENARVLARIRPKAVAVRLGAYANDRDPVVRAYSIAGASVSADPALVEEMYRGARDSDSLVRQICVDGLGDHYQPRFRNRLGGSARSDSSRLVRNAATRALVAQQDDPLARRLGRRYYSQPLLLIEDIGREIRSYILQIGTAVVLLLMTAGAFRSMQGLGPGTFPLVALAVAGVLGLWWGGVAKAVSGSEENSLAFVVLPSFAVAGYFIRHKTRRIPELAAALRAATLRVFGVFYASFALGLAWVWGFLGF